MAKTSSEKTNDKIGDASSADAAISNLGYEDAMKQLVLVNEVAGPEWLDPKLFRIGASALLNDLLMQRMKMRDGYYANPNYVTLD